MCVVVEQFDVETTPSIIKTACLYSKKDTWVTETLFPILQSANDIKLMLYPKLGLPIPRAIVDMMNTCDRIIIFRKSKLFGRRMAELCYQSSYNRKSTTEPRSHTNSFGRQ